MAKKVVVAKGKEVPIKKAQELKKGAGSSNSGKYKKVKPSEFAGAAGGSSKYSYPINTKARAKSALKLAHYAPDPAGIKAKVVKKFPSLKKANKKSKK